MGKSKYSFLFKTYFSCRFRKEIAKIINEGAIVTPKRLEELGYQFMFPDMRSAMNNIAANSPGLATEIKELLC